MDVVGYIKTGRYNTLMGVELYFLLQSTCITLRKKGSKL